MVALSWPPGAGPVPYGRGSFNYDDSAGVGTTAYNIDYSCYKGHPEFVDVRSTMRSLFPGPNPATGDIQETDRKRHGTRGLSKIVGKNFGMVKRASAVVTMIEITFLIPENYLDALVKNTTTFAALRAAAPSLLSTDLSLSGPSCARMPMSGR